MNDIFHIDFEPLGRRGEIHPGQSILEAARFAGVGLVSICGGAGTCAECRIRIVSGKLTPVTLVEEDVFNSDELTAGFRLACQAEALSDVKLDIPASSLTAAQRLQLDGIETQVELDPAIKRKGAYGLAVDIGTTKLAAYLVNFDNGDTVARAGAMNPQIAFGEDVISRIAYTERELEGAKKLQSVLIQTINDLVEELCAKASISRTSIFDAVFVGNTVMHHLVAGLPVKQLGHAPFSPASTASITIPAEKLWVDLGPGASIYLPPVIAGYVGADNLAMILATNIWKSTGNVIALDIGTNTEIALIANRKITCCSCASGPAFEGAHIHEGMRAAPGAIERAQWSNGNILWQTIGGQLPIGICGSGILDVTAALLDGGLVKSTGALNTGTGSNFVLVPELLNGLGRDLVVTRKDINEIQLAKSAIRAGLEVLLREAGLVYNNLDEFLVAGAFGTYLNLQSAIRTGMFPDLPMKKIRQVGNAAGVGAKQMLLSVNQRQNAENLAHQIDYIELTTRPDFTSLFMDNISFSI